MLQIPHNYSFFQGMSLDTILTRVIICIYRLEACIKSALENVVASQGLGPGLARSALGNESEREVPYESVSVADGDSVAPA